MSQKNIHLPTPIYLYFHSFPAMTKVSNANSLTDSEIGSIRSSRVSKLSAILCPTICALLLVSIFAISFIGTKLAYEQYDALCAGRRFDVAKLYIFSHVPPQFNINRPDIKADGAGTKQMKPK